MVQERWGPNCTHCSFSCTVGKEREALLAETISFTFGLYAISIHKSQGMTLRNLVVIELGLFEFCRGLSFVAISQARAITDIAFLNRIGEQRLKKLGGQDRVAVDLHRHQQLPFYDEGSAEALGYRFND